MDPLSDVPSLLKPRNYGPAGSLYRFFRGNLELLANGNLEADFAAPPGGSVVQEVKGSDGAQQVVWQAVTKGTNQYRAFRMPSLYPGVQWEGLAGRVGMREARPEGTARGCGAQFYEDGSFLLHHPDSGKWRSKSRLS